jgi:hypothetical protein
VWRCILLVVAVLGMAAILLVFVMPRVKAVVRRVERLET